MPVFACAIGSLLKNWAQKSTVPCLWGWKAIILTTIATTCWCGIWIPVKRWLVHVFLRIPRLRLPEDFIRRKSLISLVCVMWKAVSWKLVEPVSIPAYRNGATISCLWSGLAQFMENNRFMYLMGCASISMEDGGIQANLIMDQLRGRYLTPESLRVDSLRALPRMDDDTVLLAHDVRMPPLLKAYLRLGAQIGGEPFWDEDFNTADVFIWLARSNLQRRYVRHFVQRKQDGVFDSVKPRQAA